MGQWILFVLVITPGVWSGDWGVTLRSQCALKGTSVVLQCDYDYPFGNIVTSVHWSKAQLTSGKWILRPVSELHSSPHHFTYVGNYRGDCDLKVTNVQSSDEGAYFFSFVTTFNRWRSQTYAYLSVKELTAFVQPSNVTEGHTVRLTCESGCPESTEVVWFKDGRRVRSPVFQASREDAGSYHCAVLGQETVKSAPVALNVLYAPTNVTLSLSPSGDIVKGSAVIFTCSSDAQPPVTQSGYSLYKDGEFFSSGKSHIILDVHLSQSGLYHCRASNGISQRGSNFTNSPEVQLDVLYPPMNVSVSVNLHHIIVGSGVNLTCSSDANPAADNYTWFKRTQSPTSSWLVQVGSGQVLSFPVMESTHTGLYLCYVTNKLGGTNSTEMMLAMAEDQRGSQPLPVLAVVGVSFLVILIIAVLLFWKRQKYSAEKIQAKSDSRLGGEISDSENPSESVYSNIPMFASSRPRGSVQPPLSFEDEVIYTTVTIKAGHNNKNKSRRPQDSWFKEQENDSSVIYATVVKSS